MIFFIFIHFFIFADRQMRIGHCKQCHAGHHPSFIVKREMWNVKCKVIGNAAAFGFAPMQFLSRHDDAGEYRLEQLPNRFLHGKKFLSRCEPFAPIHATGSNNGFAAPRTGRVWLCHGRWGLHADCASPAPRGSFLVGALGGFRAEEVYIFFFKNEVDKLLMLVSRMSFYGIESFLH